MTGTGVPDLLGWPHVFTDGTSTGPVLLLLHGTGGDEHDLLLLGDLLLPGAPVLSPRGQVLENGIRRWFRRYGEGSFDVADVRRRATDLTGFLTTARTQHNLGTRPIVAAGLSNGANIALATLMLHPHAISTVIAFSGMYPFGDETVATDLTGTQVLLLNAADDPMAPTSSVDRLETSLRTRGADTTRHTRAGTHGLAQTDLAQARTWLQHHPSPALPQPEKDPR